MRRAPPAAERAMRGALLLAALLSGFDGVAAELTVEVTDARGRPAADAVIELDSSGVPAPPVAPQTRVIDQKHETFIPYVEVFRPGDQVVYSNSDETRHHVYSFSPAKSFEFVLRPGERSPAQTLDSDGSIAVGCNIHDRMVSYLYVTRAGWIARTDANGRARIADLPVGEYVLRIWHPQLKTGAAPPPRAVVLDSRHARQHSSFALALRPDPRGLRDPERGHY